MEVQLPPVPEVSEPLPLAQEPVPPLFEIQAAEVNQEDIWRELEQQEQSAPTGGAKLTRPPISFGRQRSSHFFQSIFLSSFFDPTKNSEFSFPFYLYMSF